MENTKIVQQKLSLFQEAEIGFYCIETGLGQMIKNIPYAPNPVHFGWYLLLSTGIERLLKVIICMHEFETRNAFPSEKYMRHLGHDLLKLCDEVLSRCFTLEYVDRYRWAKEDKEFILQDPILLHILRSLGDFAQRDRYLFMDNISSPTIGAEWPKNRWEEIGKVALGSKFWELLQNNEMAEVRKKVNLVSQICLEKFTRAMARLFVYGNLGALARSQTALIYEFLSLEDNDLGIRLYNP